MKSTEHRGKSITGRPEEFYKTVKKPRPKGMVLQVGHYVSDFISLFFSSILPIFFSSKIKATRGEIGERSIWSGV